jgi:hypothetical protein
MNINCRRFNKYQSMIYGTKKYNKIDLTPDGLHLINHLSILLYDRSYSNMRSVSLIGFVTVMWLMILMVSAFLVIFVPRMDVVLIKNLGYNRITVSIFEAFISISSVVILIFGLSKMKNYYMRKKLEL